MKFKDRTKVFEAGRALSNNLGNIAQNEFDFNHLDICEECACIDLMVTRLLQYKQLLYSQVIPN